MTGFWEQTPDPAAMPPPHTAVPEEPPPPGDEAEYGENVVLIASRGKRAKPEWKKDWQTSENGSPLPNLFNAMVALRKHPTLADLLRYDEMAHAVILTKQIPHTPEDGTIPRPIRDADVLAIQEELQLTGLRRLAKATVQDAIHLCADQHRYHPVRDYLNGLVWDETPRIFGWLGRYLGVEGGPYSDKIGELFMIALVARQFEAGCKADYMLILEGPQGAMKSSACRALAGKWFSDNLPDLSRGDAVRLSMHLRGKWLIEIAEMSSFSAAETHTLKEFITQTDERYTPKYGKHEVYEPRQCLFVGTTNEAAYLRDATGARRFWPVKVDEIDIVALTSDRDQLLAEAVHRYREGAPWWPDRQFELEHIAPQQDERYETHPWQDTIEAWVAEHSVMRTTVNNVLTGPLNIPTPQIGTRQQREVIAIFGRMKWTRSRSNGKTWFNRPPQSNLWQQNG